MALSIPSTFTASTVIYSASMDANFAAILNHIQAAELTANSLVMISGSTNLAGLAPGTAPQLLKTVGSAPVWTTLTASDVVVPVISTTGSRSILTTDRTILISTGSSALTATLPDASTCSGQEFLIKKTDSGTGTVALDTTSSQTIDGNTSGTLTLATPNERIKVVSDGANWQILDHQCNTNWVSFTPTIVGFGTCTHVTFSSRRVGDSLEVQGYFQAGTVTTSSNTISVGFNGTNNNVTFDTTKLPNQSHGNYLGSASTSAANAYALAVVTSGINLIALGVQSNTLSGLDPTAGNSTLGTGTCCSLIARIPIQGWFT